jgi:hypothetical protein
MRAPQQPPGKIKLQTVRPASSAKKWRRFLIFALGALTVITMIVWLGILGWGTVSLARMFFEIIGLS